MTRTGAGWRGRLLNAPMAKDIGYNFAPNGPSSAPNDVVMDKLAMNAEGLVKAAR